MELPVNRFKQALREGRTQIGLWSHLCSPISIEILAHCGYDWLLIDMEHSPNDLQQVLSQLQAMTGGSATPIVRPPWNDMVTFKRLLDIGAQSLLVPYVQTEDEARQAVAYIRYPPMGVRGYAGAPRASHYGRVQGYAQRNHEEICVLVQVETLQGLENLESIARATASMGSSSALAICPPPWGILPTPNIPRCLPPSTCHCTNPRLRQGSGHSDRRRSARPPLRRSGLSVRCSGG